MDEQLFQEAQNSKTIQNSFLGRFNMDSEEKYTLKNYLITPMRFSVLESLLMRFLFEQSNRSEYSLYPYLKETQDDPEKKSLFIAFMKVFSDIFDSDSPLYFFNQMSKELNKLLKEEDLSKTTFDNYILKTEFFLAWHFENNFYPKASMFERIEQFVDNVYLQKGITNYIYSVQSFNTVEKFLKVFEKQSLCARIDDDISLIKSLFCSEKVYYFYCEKANKRKIICGNIVKYLLQQLGTKIEKNLNNNKVNSAEIENYIMMNLYLIDKIIQNYSFYLYKNPELVEVFNSLEVYKTWPCPISNYCNHVLENIINENSFQGISLLNKLRQMYYLDLIDNNISVINTKSFRYTLVVNSKLSEENEDSASSTKSFNIQKFLDYLKDKPKHDYNQKLVIKEILVKLLITIIFNGDQNFNDDTFKKIYEEYLPNYKNIYTNEYSDNDQTKNSLDKLLKIIDVGFDKPISDFNKEINLIAKKIISSIEKNPIKNNTDDNIWNNKFFLPINSMRNYLKPNYSEFKKIFKDDQYDIQQAQYVVNIYDSYIKTFTEVVNTYFKFMLTTSSDPITENNLKIMRRNFFENFRINVLLIEKENTINDLIENFQNKIFNNLDSKISEEDFEKFWKYFVDDKTKVIPKYLLYVVPYYDRSNSNPFRLLTQENALNNKESYLSEFIANNDYIYKNLIFMPFASNSDSELNLAIDKLDKETQDPIASPALSDIYRYLRKPLDYYLGDSNGIFNLDLYQLTINDGTKKKVFYKNVEILDKINDPYKQTKLTITCVDLLGIEEKEVKEINLKSNDFDIKIFNLFYKNNVPFNYNMNSNNGWLEMFLDDKYDFEETYKFCNFSSFLELNKDTKFYEEFNMPQTDIETRFKNYKIKNILIESNSPTIIIRCDDYMDIDYESSVDLDVTKKSGNELKLKIKIEPYTIQDQRYSIPIATFTTI